jgi:hypothetical protein
MCSGFPAEKDAPSPAHDPASRSAEIDPRQLEAECRDAGTSVPEEEIDVIVHADVDVPDTGGGFPERCEGEMGAAAGADLFQDGGIVEQPGGERIPSGGPAGRCHGIKIRCEDDVPRERAHAGEEVVVFGIFRVQVFEERFDADCAHLQVAEGLQHQSVEIPPDRPVKGPDRILVDVYHRNARVGLPRPPHVVPDVRDLVFDALERGAEEDQQGECRQDHASDVDPLTPGHCRPSHCSGFCFSFPFHISKWRRGPFSASPVYPITSPSLTFAPSAPLISARCV